MKNQKSIDEMTDAEFDAMCKDPKALESAMIQELKDPKSPMHKFVSTIKVEVRS